jgi:hypothetical protein
MVLVLLTGLLVGLSGAGVITIDDSNGSGIIGVRAGNCTPYDDKNINLGGKLSKKRPLKTCNLKKILV